MSKQRQRENVLRRQAMIEVRQRDGHQCVGSMRRSDGDTFLPGPCYGALNGHEIITRGDGGSITDPANIVLLCNHHNEWCDLNKNEAVTRGFRQLRFDPRSSRVAFRLPHISAPDRSTIPPSSVQLPLPPGADQRSGAVISDPGAVQSDAPICDAAAGNPTSPRPGRFDTFTTQENPKGQFT